jgi:hypothetical protein
MTQGLPFVLNFFKFTDDLTHYFLLLIGGESGLHNNPYENMNTSQEIDGGAGTECVELNS